MGLACDRMVQGEDVGQAQHSGVCRSVRKIYLQLGGQHRQELLSIGT